MHRIFLGLAAAAALTLGATTDASAQGISIGFSSGYGGGWGGGYGGGWGGHAVQRSRYGGHHHHHAVSPRYGASVYRAPINYGYGGGYPYGVSANYGYGYSNPYVTRRPVAPRYRVCPQTGRYLPY